LHTLVDVARGFLRGAFLGKTIGLSDPLAAHTHFDSEGLGVFRSALANIDISRLRQVARLGELL
jgi:hypothetical protein